jgi:hypothetical protein
MIPVMGFTSSCEEMQQIDTTRRRQVSVRVSASRQCWRALNQHTRFGWLADKQQSFAKQNGIPEQDDVVLKVRDQLDQ